MVKVRKSKVISYSIQNLYAYFFILQQIGDIYTEAQQGRERQFASSHHRKRNKSKLRDRISIQKNR